MNKPVMKIDEHGTKRWRLDSKLHRDDGPAIEYSDGNKSWYHHGVRHRTDGPAIEFADGSKMWFLNDKLHREDGPAVENADGSKDWYLNDKKVDPILHFILRSNITKILEISIDN